MSEHRHKEIQPGCWRCELNKDELLDSLDWQAVENVIGESLAKCRYAEDYAIDAAQAVLGFARTPEGREIFARAMELQWVEGAVETRPETPHIPRGKHNGVLWLARRLVGDWEQIPYCRACSNYHSGGCA